MQLISLIYYLPIQIVKKIRRFTYKLQNNNLISDISIKKNNV